MTNSKNGKIVNCDFRFKCPQAWEKMDETENDGVRFCGECQKNVYFADNPESLQLFARQGKCVAVLQQMPNINFQSNSSQLKDSAFEEPQYINQITAGMPASPERSVKQQFESEKLEGPPYWILTIIGLVIGFLLIISVLIFLIPWLILR